MQPTTSLRSLPVLSILLLLTPVTPFIGAYHDIFYYRQWPNATIWTAACAYTVVALAIGLWLMVRYEDSFAERI